MSQIKQLIKVGISGLVFESSIPKKILLIKREKAPYASHWSFPGGRLEFGETISNGIEREVKEETGYTVETINSHFNINEIIRDDSHYLICSNWCRIKGEQSKEHEDIIQQFFYLDKYYGKNINERFNLSDLKESDCIPRLHDIIDKMMKTHFAEEILKI